MILTPDRVRTEQIAGKTLVIKEKIIPDSARSKKDQASWCMTGQKVKPCRPIGDDGTPRGVCIHNTGDIATPAATNPAEQYTRATWPNCNMGGAAVHFFVYDGEIWQNLRENEQGWHAGDGSFRRVVKRPGAPLCGNLDTIAIECIGDRQASEETTAYLAAYLLKKYGMTVKEDLYAHRDFAKKYCPAYILPHWENFCEKVQKILEKDRAFDPGHEPVKKKEEEAPFCIDETVSFLGGYSFVNSMAPAPAGERKKPCRAKITLIVGPAKHPFHLVSGDGALCGWVDREAVAKIKEETPLPAFQPAKVSARHENRFRTEMKK